MMLKSWSIENFKPIFDSGELQFAPVTVLAGRNSSGKSSLLQSILMIKQTLSSKLVDRPLLPSGLDVQLGTFEDVLNKNSSLGTLSISFTLDFTAEESSSIRRRPPSINMRSVNVTATFDSGKVNSTSHSAVEASKVLVENVSLTIIGESVRLRLIGEESPITIELIEDNKEESEVNFSFKKMTTNENDIFLKNVVPDYLRLVPYPEGQANYLGNFGSKALNESYLIGLSHFLPTRLIRRFNIDEDRKSALKKLFHNQLRSIQVPSSSSTYTRMLAQQTRLSSLQTLDFDAHLSEHLMSAIQALCQEKGITAAFSGQTLRELIDWYRYLKGVPGRKKASIGDELEEIIVRHLMQDLSVGNEPGRDFEGLRSFYTSSSATLLEEAVDQITRFFTSNIRYLGPLRADPHDVQKFAPSSEYDDVGAKGEYAAAVYDANQNARIDWYNPISQKVERSTLKFALDSWVRYLDVANRIETKEAGQSGFGWRVVSKRAQTAFPLSAVGVGVSQVLPILAMGLLAPGNTLLIVEQPELHLHPSIQARLGDFFVGLAKCKKQCLIETHSENLISQLRYHIVQAGGMDKSDCMIYFVDQDENGAAKFEPVEISPQGNILNWPEGFFDETMLQEDRITAASIKKRAIKAKNA